MRKKVFLGGICNDSDWRDILISYLEIDYFDPVVIDWTEECQEREIEERQGADIVLYVITPKVNNRSLPHSGFVLPNGMAKNS